MLKLLVLCALVAFCVEAQITTGAARNLQTFAFPPQNPRLVEVVGVSRTKNNVTKTFDAVQFLLNTLGEATLQFNYFASSSAVTNGANPGPKNTASNFAIAFRTFAVFEFDNNDGVPGFQETQGANKDTITGVYNLNSLLLPWNPLVLQQEVKNGVNVTTLTAQTKDEVFLLKLVFSGNPTQVGSVAITPDQVKVDFVVKWFNNPLHVPSFWTTGPSNATVHPNAQVGLATITASESGTFSHVNGTNSATFQFTRSNYSTALQYANNVTVDQNGVQFNANVHVHVTSTTNNQNVQTDWAATWVFKVGFFSFEAARPSMVWWDPVLGADTMPTVAPTGGVSALSPLVLLVLLALLFIHA